MLCNINNGIYRRSVIKNITIKDIAEESEVSTATVSKIINNKDTNISSKTRERVLSIIKKYNYSPNKVASAMITKKSFTIGLIIPDITNEFFPRLVRGVEVYANSKGYSVVLCNSDNDAKKEVDYIKMLADKMIDGIILTTSSTGIVNFQKNLNANIPIVTIDRSLDDSQFIGSVSIDNVLGSYKAVSHLIKNNCKNILFFSGEEDLQVSYDRLLGYKKALYEHNLPFNKENVVFGEFSINCGYENCKKVIDIDKYDGIYCANDLIAFGVIKNLRERNINIPEDIQVIGFDDIFMSSITTPTLTTINQPAYEMGYEGAKILIDYLNKKSKNKKNIILDTKLIKRNTTIK